MKTYSGAKISDGQYTVKETETFDPLLREGREVACVLTIQAMYAVLRLMRDECLAPPASHCCVRPLDDRNDPPPF